MLSIRASTLSARPKAHPTAGILIKQKGIHHFDSVSGLFHPYASTLRVMPKGLVLVGLVGPSDSQVLIEALFTPYVYEMDHRHGLFAIAAERRGWRFPISLTALLMVFLWKMIDIGLKGRQYGNKSMGRTFQKISKFSTFDRLQKRVLKTDSPRKVRTFVEMRTFFVKALFARFFCKAFLSPSRRLALRTLTRDSKVLLRV